MVGFRRRAYLARATVLVAIVTLSACGGSEAEPAGEVEGGVAIVQVAMGSPEEYTLAPEPAVVQAGPVAFRTTNEGTLPHELLVIRTDAGAANLDAGGVADESGAIERIRLDPGVVGELVLDLEPGAYALVCNLPGHYAAGMHSDLEVK